ncbi:hypothetical protein H5T87_06270 [bacterium]|nr:hypothetical protein [bacterium]
MIKINLLPAYVKERKVVRKLLVLVFILLGLELLGFSFWYYTLSSKGYDVGQQLETAKAQAQEVQNLQAEAQRIRGEIEPIKAKTKFIEDAANFPVQIANLLDSIRRYTYAKVTYTSLQLGSGAGGGMGPMMMGKGPMGGMPGAGGGMPGMGSQMPGMMGGGMPGMGGPMGGGGSAQPITTVSIQGYTDTVEDVARYIENLLRCPDIADVQVSGIPGYGGGGAAPGMSGMPGMMGGMPGMMGKAPMMGGSMPAMGGMPGMVTAQGQGGVNISVVCFLMKPLTPPSPPTAAPAQAGGGMPGMGMPGMGMPGMGMPGAAAPGAKAPSAEGGRGGLGQRRQMEQEMMEGM